MVKENWDVKITPSVGVFDLKLREVWSYRDLLMQLVRRDFVSIYKQTILGPLWFFIQPILTTLIYIIIFNKVAKLSTGDSPPILFYLTGITMWNYLAECINSTSSTFTKNADVFGKVYFPRIIVPISIVISNLLKFGVQLLLLVVFYVFYLIKGVDISIDSSFFLFPFLVILMALLGLGIGMIISSLTTKYRDLTFLVTFGVQLLMYTCPVIYTFAALPEKYKILILMNPMTSIVETFRYSLLGPTSGSFDWMHLAYSSGFAITVILIGIIIFNQIQKSFMDTV
jgi:lipopolysaccharide transport system permease protein